MCLNITIGELPYWNFYQNTLTKRASILITIHTSYQFLIMAVLYGEDAPEEILLDYWNYKNEQHESF